MPMTFNGVFCVALTRTNASPTTPAVTTSVPSLLQMWINSEIEQHSSIDFGRFTSVQSKSSEFCPFRRHSARTWDDTMPIPCTNSVHVHYSEWQCARMAAQPTKLIALSPNIDWYCTWSTVRWPETASADTVASMPVPAIGSPCPFRWCGIQCTNSNETTPYPVPHTIPSRWTLLQIQSNQTMNRIR